MLVTRACFYPSPFLASKAAAEPMKECQSPSFDIPSVDLVTLDSQLTKAKYPLRDNVMCRIS